MTPDDGVALFRSAWYRPDEPANFLIYADYLEDHGREWDSFYWRARFLIDARARRGLPTPTISWRPGTDSALLWHPHDGSLIVSTRLPLHDCCWLRWWRPWSAGGTWRVSYSQSGGLSELPACPDIDPVTAAVARNFYDRLLANQVNADLEAVFTTSPSDHARGTNS